MALDQATLDVVSGLVAAEKGITREAASAVVQAAVPATAVDNSAENAHNNETNTAQKAEKVTTNAAAQSPTGATPSSEGSAAVQANQSGLNYDEIARQRNIPVDHIRGKSQGDIDSLIAVRDSEIARLQPIIAEQVRQQLHQQQNSRVETPPPPASPTGQSTGSSPLQVEIDAAILEGLKKEFDPEAVEAMKEYGKAIAAQVAAAVAAKYEPELKALKESETQRQQESAKQENAQIVTLIESEIAKGYSDQLGKPGQRGPQYQEKSDKFFRVLNAIKAAEPGPLTAEQVQRSLVASLGPVTTTTGQQAATLTAQQVQEQANQRMGKPSPATIPAASVPYEGKMDDTEAFLKTPQAIEFFNRLGK